MENYIVSARKYRPSTFDSVVGQRALTTTLKNAIASNKLAHAYLFCGSRGVGKTTCARIFAKTINCLSPTADGEACNECESCRAFNEQRSYNIHELDAASNNSVDDIRQLVDQVRVPPQVGKYKVYIIDEVHMLSSSAFNAFLKTLEEPPQYAIFILATTEKHKIIPTILSRCQIYDFNRITVEDIVQHLSYVAQNEGVKAEPEALNVIAVKADGGMRDALSIFDQTVSFTGGNLTYERVIENLNVLDYEYYFRLTDLFLANKVSDALMLFDNVLQKGFDGNHFVTGLASHFRDLLVSKDSSTLSLLQVGASIRQRYQEQAQRCPLPFLYKAMKLCNDCDLNFKVSRNKRLLVELTLIQLAQITDENADIGGPGPKKTLQPVFNKPQAASVAAQPAQAQTQPAAQHPQMQSQMTGQPVQVSSPANRPASPVAVGQPVPNAAVVPPAPQPVPMPQPIPGRYPQQNGNGAQPSSAAPQVSVADMLQKASAAGKHAPVVAKSSLGISIKKIYKEEKVEHVSQVREQTVTFEDQPFDAQKLGNAWLTYAMSLPVEQKAFAMKMKNAMPALQADGVTFEVVVDNELAQRDFLNASSNLLHGLRNSLKNSKVAMTVRVSEANEHVMAISPVERFQKMSQKNGVLLQLQKEFGLELY